MIDAFLYALDQVAVPAGRKLWLYGDPALVDGDVYHPLQDQAGTLERKADTLFSDIHAITGDYDAVFVHCPKQREETEGLLAFALKRSRGFVMAVAPNDAGGGRLQGMLKAYDIPMHLLSKNKCRIVWTHQAQDADKSLVWQNALLLDPLQLELGGAHWWSVPGLFGWDKIDPGSQLLLERLPPDIAGNVADFGCGYGYLAAMLARRYPAIHSIDAYDVDARAVACCTRNGNEKIHPQWCDIRSLAATPRYDWIVMNPPFHSGKAENPGLGMAFIQKAYRCLKPGGRMFLVANRHLAYEHTVPGLEVVFEGEGYKIICGRPV